MKKSEHYTEAMKAVLTAGIHSVEEKIEILETLMDGRSGAEFSERLEAEKQANAAKEAAQG